MPDSMGIRKSYVPQSPPKTEKTLRTSIITNTLNQAPPQRLGESTIKGPSFNPSTAYVSPNSIIKEITKDVYLIKEYVETTISGSDKVEQFVFKLTNNSLKQIDFSIDFKDSENIKLGLYIAA